MNSPHFKSKREKAKIIVKKREGAKAIHILTSIFYIIFIIVYIPVVLWGGNIIGFIVYLIWIITPFSYPEY